MTGLISLPPEVIAHIISFLRSLKDLKNLSASSRFLNRVVENNQWVGVEGVRVSPDTFLMRNKQLFSHKQVADFNMRGFSQSFSRIKNLKVVTLGAWNWTSPYAPNSRLPNRHHYVFLLKHVTPFHCTTLIARHQYVCFKKFHHLIYRLRHCLRHLIIDCPGNESLVSTIKKCKNLESLWVTFCDDVYTSEFYSNFPNKMKRFGVINYNSFDLFERVNFTHLKDLILDLDDLHFPQNTMPSVETLRLNSLLWNSRPFLHLFPSLKHLEVRLKYYFQANVAVLIALTWLYRSQFLSNSIYSMRIHLNLGESRDKMSVHKGFVDSSTYVYSLPVAKTSSFAAYQGYPSGLSFPTDFVEMCRLREPRLNEFIKCHFEPIYPLKAYFMRNNLPVHRNVVAVQHASNVILLETVVWSKEGPDMLPFPEYIPLECQEELC